MRPCDSVRRVRAVRCVVAALLALPLAGAALPGAAGSPCQAPPGASDVRANTPVQVSSPDGRSLASGRLGAGVLQLDSGTAHCNFPFEIRAVPGGQAVYVVRVGTRAPVSFPARELREDRPAVIEVFPVVEVSPTASR
jgi:hypothetical protein